VYSSSSKFAKSSEGFFQTTCIAHNIVQYAEFFKGKLALCIFKALSAFKALLAFKALSAFITLYFIPWRFYFISWCFIFPA
jgi:hypothetical protein